MPSPSQRKKRRRSSRKDESLEFHVEKIIDKRINNNGTTEFLVKWYGFDETFNSWESKENCGNSTMLIKKFESNARASRKQKRNTFYAIAFGRKTGVFFNNWDDAKFLTEYYTGAIFKGFEQINDAWEFVLSKNNQATLPKSMNEYYSLSN